MSLSSSSTLPRVSVIIPCYNHGRYLQEAIDSILQQTHPVAEVIVVDDGSTDNTRAVALQNPQVKYIHQKNKGLSAARNKGIAQSTGEFLVFLDADDYLYLDAIAVNLSHLLKNDQLAFVAGSHNRVYTYSNQVNPVVKQVGPNHYTNLLKGNYIGMHATVMFRRWIFDSFKYDTSLKACEDYDLYLKITRTHPISHHSHIVAAYRFHNNNMSGNASLMLATALKTLKRQKKHLRNEIEYRAYEEGNTFWEEYYLNELYKKVAEKKKLSPADFLTLLKYDRPFLYDYLHKQSTLSLKVWASNHIPSSIKRVLKVYLLRK